MPAEKRAMTLRLPEDVAEELELVAATDDASVSEVVRSAIAEHIERRRKDEAFQERLQVALERNQRIMERLAR